METETSFDAEGGFARTTGHFDDRITADGSSGWPVEPGRYRLVVSKACPLASRSLVARRLLGLEDAISLGVVDPACLSAGGPSGRARPRLASRLSLSAGTRPR